jgi:hypothetical protein
MPSWSAPPLTVGAAPASGAGGQATSSTQTGNRHVQEGKTMNYSERLDTLQQRVTAAKAAVQDAGRESREQLRQRIDQAQADVDRATDSARQRADQAGADARSKWAQMRADAATKAEDVKGKIDKRNRELDAKAAAKDADWAETDAAAALDFADWAVDNARLAMLDAIDARVYAEQLAKVASS